MPTLNKNYALCFMSACCVADKPGARVHDNPLLKYFLFFMIMILILKVVVYVFYTFICIFSKVFDEFYFGKVWKT